jgi:uncharacterized membrane protein
MTKITFRARREHFIRKRGKKKRGVKNIFPVAYADRLCALATLLVLKRSEELKRAAACQSFEEAIE